MSERVGLRDITGLTGSFVSEAGMESTGGREGGSKG